MIIVVFFCINDFIPAKDLLQAAAVHNDADADTDCCML